jgi:alkaline phosphatase D
LVACGGGETPIRFMHGVASGDPLTDRIMLWTRITPDADDSFSLRWEVSSQADFAQLVASGSASTDASVDYTVKADATGLAAGQSYFFRFVRGADVSPVGRTRTLPAAGAASVSLAVFSCANYPAGFFNAYAAAAQHAGVQFALHLGDYIYEYGRGGYASENAAALGREVLPANELLSLADYRQRYAQYRSDADLQALHAALPMIAVWDDHEIANDTWREGADNHQPDTEGLFSLRKAAALKAWLEWLPVRQPDANAPDRIYRSFDFGGLLALHMLDTRVIGRDPQQTVNEYLTGAAFAPSRQLLGSTQQSWLLGQLQSSTATWQVLGQQVLMARMTIPASVAQAPTVANVTDYVTAVMTPAGYRTTTQQALVAQPKLPYNLDAWDGYPVARETVLSTAKTLGRNLVVLAGDTHNAWASNLTLADGSVAGVEFATSSVSSPGFEAYLLEVPPAQLSAAFPVLVDDLVWAETAQRGYLVVNFTPSAASAQWVAVASINTRSTSTSVLTSLRTLAGTPGVVAA